MDLVPLLTDKEAAERLGCHISTVGRLRRKGELPYLPGRPPLIRLTDLDDYVSRHTKRPKTPEEIEQEISHALWLRAQRSHFKMRMRATLLRK